MNLKNLAVIVLAAGKGTRMKSSLAKVLQILNSKPLLNYVLDSFAPLNPDLSIVVVGFQSEIVKKKFKGRGLVFVEQKEQLGTGHAAQQAKTTLGNFSGDVLIVCGDMPFIKPQTLADLLNIHRAKQAACTVLTLKGSGKKDFGRIIRGGNGMVSKITEYKDASIDEKKVDEYNSGVYCFDKVLFCKALESIGNNNTQKEYYLTDTIEYMAKNSFLVESLQIKDAVQLLGINTQEDLHLAEKIITEQIGSS
jgi:UDP-N-acetylglucosamine diphosphorylase/glucosamine-1-phosphate N-acetyltransferase